MGTYLLHSGQIAMLAMQPVMITLLLAALDRPDFPRWLAVRRRHHGAQIQPHEPGAGLKRMFSAKALIELLKALAKFFIVLFVALAVLSADIDDLLRIAHEPLDRRSSTACKWSAGARCGWPAG